MRSTTLASPVPERMNWISRWAFLLYSGSLLNISAMVSSSTRTRSEPLPQRVTVGTSESSLAALVLWQPVSRARAMQQARMAARIFLECMGKSTFLF